MKIHLSMSPCLEDLCGCKTLLQDERLCCSAWVKCSNGERKSMITRNCRAQARKSQPDGFCLLKHINPYFMVNSITFLPRHDCSSLQVFFFSMNFQKMPTTGNSWFTEITWLTSVSCTTRHSRYSCPGMLSSWREAQCSLRHLSYS